MASWTVAAWSRASASVAWGWRWCAAWHKGRRRSTLHKRRRCTTRHERRWRASCTTIGTWARATISKALLESTSSVALSSAAITNGRIAATPTATTATSASSSRSRVARAASSVAAPATTARTRAAAAPTRWASVTRAASCASSGRTTTTTTATLWVRAQRRGQTQQAEFVHLQRTLLNLKRELLLLLLLLLLHMVFGRWRRVIIVQVGSCSGRIFRSAWSHHQAISSSSRWWRWLVTQCGWCSRRRRWGRFWALHLLEIHLQLCLPLGFAAAGAHDPAKVVGKKETDKMWQLQEATHLAYLFRLIRHAWESAIIKSTLFAGSQSGSKIRSWMGLITAINMLDEHFVNP